MTTDGLRKAMLAFLMALSFAFYAPFIMPDISSFNFGRLIGFIGLQLLWWQVVLGNRFVTRFITSDLLWINKLHRLSGTYGFLVILLHPFLMIASYGLSLVLIPSFATTFDIGVRAGTLGLTFLGFVWFTSALFRKRIEWRWWKRLHLAAYFLFPLLFVHMLLTGESIEQSLVLAVWLYGLAALFVVVIVVRLAGWAGFLPNTYTLVESTKVADSVTRFRFLPVGKGLAPEPGQFAYLKAWKYGEAHPFTISHYDPNTGEISFSIKAVGPYSSQLTELQPKNRVSIDGPFGVFTKNLNRSGRPVVAVAGGIGITPFLRHLEEKSIDYIFWGLKTEADIVYKDTLENAGAKLLFALSDQAVQKPGYVSGNITVELLQQHVHQPLTECDIYLCGPPAMMESLHTDLIACGVPKTQIDQEKFSL